MPACVRTWFQKPKGKPNHHREGTDFLVLNSPSPEEQAKDGLRVEAWGQSWRQAACQQCSPQHWGEKKKQGCGVVWCGYNPTAGEAEAGGLPGQPRLQDETTSKDKNHGLDMYFSRVLA